MSDTLLVSTRKGLFTVTRKAKQWEITAVDFLGDNVTLTLGAVRQLGPTVQKLDAPRFAKGPARPRLTVYEGGLN